MHVGSWPVASVVREKDNGCFFIKVKCFDLVHDQAHAIIHRLDHGGHFGILMQRPWLLGEVLGEQILFCLNRRMNGKQGQVNKPGRCLFFFNELTSALAKGGREKFIGRSILQTGSFAVRRVIPFGWAPCMGASDVEIKPVRDRILR